jgi:hypothetical protein
VNPLLFVQDDLSIRLMVVNGHVRYLHSQENTPLANKRKAMTSPEKLASHA